MFLPAGEHSSGSPQTPIVTEVKRTPATVDRGAIPSPLIVPRMEVTLLMSSDDKSPDFPLEFPWQL